MAGSVGMRFREAAEPVALRALREQLGVFLDRAGADEELKFDVMLAVSEAANNVLQHAYRNASRPGTIQVTASTNRDTISVVVEDDGGGLAPRPDSPGAGLGLPLMARLTHDLDVHRRPEGGTSVALAWKLGA